LLAPYLQYNAPTARPNSGGWVRPYTPRIAVKVIDPRGNEVMRVLRRDGELRNAH
jgi:hypothetical protein